ncbi:hypothetical protein TrVFT333_005866 [Trichoderma virens FT-333]|nr:hypothetical protein TrVFT333_005866 [Trichoderma virens FT-333]
MSIHVHPTKTIYLIDVQSLGEKCFSTPGKCLKTLRDILKSPLIPKVFFDVRSDSDALFALFNITLDGVLDLQLMEFATRSVLRKSWKSVKEQGRLLFTPKSGGSYEVLNERPLRQDILRYCAQDVSVMPVLWSVYDSKITQEWKQKVVVASRDRVWRSHEVDYMYISAGRDMAKAPLILTDPDPVVTG